MPGDQSDAMDHIENEVTKDMSPAGRRALVTGLAFASALASWGLAWAVAHWLGRRETRQAQPVPEKEKTVKPETQDNKEDQPWNR